ncbi:hypothetical protein DFH06DRAFT_1428694 [Mycena polygramma]|nr:hypothetical protein DFH06DRAFT_1428694 [Mycena polygramma]
MSAANLFKCDAPDCEETPGSSGALTLHRKSCTKWHGYQQQQILERREKAAAAPPITAPRAGGTLRRQGFVSAKAPATLQQRKARMQSPVAEGSRRRSSPAPAGPEFSDDLATADMQDGVSSPTAAASPQLPASIPLLEMDPSAPLPPRSIRLPRRFQDILPTPLAPPPIADPVPPAADGPVGPRPPRVTLIVRDTFTTLKNKFGLWREYLHRPTYDPDTLISLDDLSNQFRRPPVPATQSEASVDPPAPPTANRTTSMLLGWLNNGNAVKSEAQLNSLVHDVLRHPDFDVAELAGFNTGRANKQVDADAQVASEFLANFKETSVEIEVPSGDVNVPAQSFEVPGLHYRSLVSVIKAAFADPLSRHFHFSPFKLFHKMRTTAAANVRVFSELYNSDAFLSEHDHIQRHGKLPPDDLRCTREKVIAALMFWSDGTHLANFGTAKLWPIYMLFGNLSKYIRGQPNADADHHVAYIPSLPDSIQDKISQFHAKWGTQKGEILTHCRRELMHAVWKLLLDDEFLHAYTYGIVIKCADGIERRVYPRLFTYSADYPEKVLLATIRDGGGCPCPRCLTPKSQLHLMGLARDIAGRVTNARKYMGDKVRIARRFIYKLAYSIGSTKVEGVLKETSSVPTFNAFIERLGDDFNLHQMLVIDFMHEFELGVWKNLFTHLIRLLYALPDGKNLVAELDRRYRQMPRFGNATIRRFATNASEMKKLGARDFEDLLQCAIPAFDGLFPPGHNERVLKLLYRMAEWHACAKLRMHTDPTLEHLVKLTPEIGRLMRQFKNTTCAEYKTFELPRETAARNRREQRAADAAAARAGGSATTATPAPPVPAAAAPPAQEKSKKEKTLNPNTYKWHAMGDYAPTIRLFSPTDSYSTQLGESLHRLVKRLYAVTNKRNHTAQIAARYMRLKRARAAARRAKGHSHHAAFGDDDPLGATPPDVHHHMSLARRKPFDMYNDLNSLTGDPATVNFIPKLKEHILGRLLNRDFDGDTHEEFTHEDRASIRILGNKIYSTRTLRINYTTYDVRRGQDTLNPRTSSFAMVRSPETERGAHPFWYCQILGIFHAKVSRVTATDYTDAEPMDFLWVRWMGMEPSHRSGIKRARLPMVGFVEESDPYAFGFLDPAHVIRGSHLIPKFNAGRTNDLLGTRAETAARAPDTTDDWVNYYVDIFVDRDMFMRYLGGGVGHASFDIESEEDDDDLEMPEDEGDPDPSDEDDDSGSESDSDEDLDSDGEGLGDPDGLELEEEDLGNEGEEDVPEDLGFDDF